MSWIWKLNVLFFAVLIISCTKKDNPPTTSPSGDMDLWLVPPEKVLYKDLPKDRIQSIDHPHFINITESNLKPDDLVLITSVENEIKIYPVAIMDVHEIVNDSANKNYFSVTYCPLTESSMLWNRKINGKVTEFGVSGMLYNENLMPYDRNTESIWSQMRLQCVHGSLMGNVPATNAIIETKFSTIQSAFPEAKVLEHDGCDSGVCGGLKETAFLKDDPVDGDTVDLPPDQNYFGIVKQEQLLLFNTELFSDSIQLFTTSFRGSSLLVCGNKELHFYTAFVNKSSGKTFRALQNSFPLIIEDNNGNRYNIFGTVKEGPEQGNRLEPATSYLARTFAWELFFTNVTLFRR